MHSVTLWVATSLTRCCLLAVRVGEKNKSTLKSCIASAEWSIGSRQKEKLSQQLTDLKQYKC